MKGRWIPLLLLVLFSCQLSGQFNPCNWKYRKRIAFDPTKVSGFADLTDFPALITFAADANLETVANGGHVENANGYDIVFTQDDGVTQLNHDLDGYSATTGSLTAWVKIPNLSATIDTYIYMYYGNAAIASDQSSPNTWSNGYVGVWHFDNSLANTTPVAGLDGTNAGSTNTTTAKFNSARSFVRASNQYVDVTPYNAAYDLTSEITVSAWVRLTTNGNDQKFAGNQDNVNGGWKFGVFSDNKIEFEIRTSGNSPFLSRSASGGSALAVNTWYYVVGIYSDIGNYIRTYRNATLDRNYSTTASMGSSGGTLKFGREPFQTNGAQLDGIIDEMRISNVVRTAGWVATEYANQNSPSTFYTISQEPKVWTAGSSGAWNTNNNWSPSGAPSTLQDVIIPNAVANRQPTLNTSVDIGALWIQSSTLNLGASTRTLGVAYDVLNCGVITGSAGVMLLNTSTIQVQHISGTGTYSLNNLIVDNQYNINPSTQLNRSVTVNGALVLNSGIVATSTANLLLLTSTAVSTSGSSQSFINGPMAKAGNAAFVFPIGKGQEWRRLRISGISTSAAIFRAEYFTTPYASTTPVTTPLDNVSQIEYWQLDRLSASGDASVSLYWENVAYSGIDDCADLEIARWNGSAWVRHDATSVSGSSCSGSGTGTIITNALVSSFSPFTFGSSSTSVNALPLHLVEFKAECEPGMIMIRWATTNERNTRSFTVERSYDGVKFDPLGTVDAKGDRKERSDYAFGDNHPKNTNTYYRLLQTDNDGAAVHSPLIVASCFDTESGLSVYPNPNAGEFTVSGLLPASTVDVFNASGQLVQHMDATQSSVVLKIGEKGLYLIRIAGQSGDHALKVLIQ